MLARALPVVALLLAGCGQNEGQGDAGAGGGRDMPPPNALPDLSTTGDLGPAPHRRPFPDTTGTIALLVDQLPGGMTAAQQQFVVAHFVGTQKLTLDLSQPLRALKPDFLVLHYHLAIWQSAAGVSFILDGKTWSNDYPSVSAHDPWFWHNQQGTRVISNVDQKLLMNVSNAELQAYWQSSILDQVAAGDYDAVFADSASPALLQGECGTANGKFPGTNDPRLAGTAVKDTQFAELGNRTYIQAWESFIGGLDAALAARGVPLIPNTSAFVTTWDNSRYDLTAGVFVEGFADPRFAEADWKASTNQLLSLAAKNKIIILQNYLGGANDLPRRLYYLANYLLVKGSRTYLDYFAAGPLEWYPEWGVDLGAPVNTGATIADLANQGVYRREFAKGFVLVNPSSSPVTVSFNATMKSVAPAGGGAVPGDGTAPGSINYTMNTSFTVPATSGMILLK